VYAKVYAKALLVDSGIWLVISQDEEDYFELLELILQKLEKGCIGNVSYVSE
jgi:hypothetical protein